jgi:mannose-1-phosphate guanylyltransferase
MNYAVIMAGGLGTRFWPLSRQKNAKQFIRLIDNQSFLEHTIDRISHSIPTSHIWIVGNKAQEAQLRDHAKKINPDHLLLEPCGKNTAPCIAWAAFELSKIDTDAIMIILPSDHMITPTDEFNRTIESAVQIAKAQDTLVTIGIMPTHPTSAYGYIETNGSSPILSVTAFHEKPNPQTAETYIKKGNFYWNSGIFVWKASVILDQIKTHLPDLYHALHTKSSDEIINTYPTLESISIDYAIMEKSAHITTLIPSTFTWSDIGSWTALDDFLPKDSHHNASEANIISHNSSNNIVHAPDKTVALIGIDNLIIVDTADALLIVPKSHDQDVKDIMGQLPDSLK